MVRKAGDGLKSRKKCNVVQGAAASAATVCVGLQFCTLFSGAAAAWCACALDAQV